MHSTDKLKTWHQIKTTMPEFAQFMIELKKVFGKLEKVEIVIK